MSAIHVYGPIPRSTALRFVKTAEPRLPASGSAALAALLPLITTPSAAITGGLYGPQIDDKPNSNYFARLGRGIGRGALFGLGTGLGGAAGVGLGHLLSDGSPEAVAGGGMAGLAGGALITHLLQSLRSREGDRPDTPTE